jgi:hypothetical protein
MASVSPDDHGILSATATTAPATAPLIVVEMDPCFFEEPLGVRLRAAAGRAVTLRVTFFEPARVEEPFAARLRVVPLVTGLLAPARDAAFLTPERLPAAFPDARFATSPSCIDSSRPP